MKQKFMILILLFVSVSGIRAQQNSPFSENIQTLDNVGPPSEQTLRQINQTAANPNLRYGPGEGGTPNKETPLSAGQASLSLILLMAAAYAAYAVKNKRKKQNKMKQLTLSILLLAVALLIPSNTLKAQGVLNANPDNFFVAPVPAGSSASSTYLDVLSNDYYADDGTIADLQLSIIKEPIKGYVQYDAASFRLEYMPMDGKVGTDSLIYQIKSKLTNRTAKATVYIHLNNKPGVISNADCFVDPQGITFDIKLIAQSDPATNVSSLSSIITGDIDNDGKVEMLVISTTQGLGTTATNLLVYNYDPNETGTYKLKIKYNIPITGWTGQWVNACFSIAKITGGTVNTKSTASIFFANPIEKILYRYDLNGSNYTETWRASLNSNRLYSSVSPIIVDLMANGQQQIVCADRVYNADTGELLAIATDTGGTALVPASGRSSYSFGCYGHNLPPSDIYESSIIAADIDDDGLPELVAGDHIYKVNIKDFTTNNPALNTYRLYRKANYQADLTTKWDATHTEVGDGGTAIADIDNDGKLDIIISGTVGGTGNLVSLACVYAYNPRTGKLFHNNVINDIPRGAANYGPSRPFVGDIDGDGYPEICLTAYNTFRAYKMDFSTSTLKEMWRTTTSDASASTTLSMFDFAQDGKARMIYRDMTSLRIIRSTDSGSVDEYTFDTGTFSGTLNECPIVIDVDGDGHAEILATASPTASWQNNGSLRVYAAAGAAKWAPARTVWNQVAYNPLYVNDDLSIPRNPLSPATKFVAADGSVSRPFNNFLQQATNLNREGTMIMEGADLTFSTRAPRKLSWQANGDLTITVTVTNQGLMSWTHPITLQMYASLPTSPVTYTKVGTVHSDANASALAPKAEKVISYTIPAAMIPAEGTYDGWGITVNLNTDPASTNHVYTYGDECRDALNNRALGFNVLDGETIACKGATNVAVKVSPAGVYNVNWYNMAGTQLAASTDIYTMPLKDNQEVTKLLVQAINKTSGLPVSNVRDTVYVYAAPDSLIWTNEAEDRDWNNPLNWRKGGVSKDNYPFANIPMGCTDVTLLAGMDAYPDLKSITQGGHSDYSLYPNASCANIFFDFGSELERPDLLTYDSARVETQFESHRWYMYAPPLKQTYSGDFYINNPIPSKDIIESYTKSWGGIHPFWGSHFESSWTTLYFMPDMEYPVGYGLGVWISDKQDRDNVFFDFEFPKKDSKYNVYFEGTDQINTHITTKTLSRSDAHRFVFDGQGAAGSNIKLEVEAMKAGSIVFVGNPFMAQLDFDKFQAANAGKIKAEYKVLNRNNNNYLYYKKGQVSQLTKDIAPMQGFLVEAIVPFTELSVDGTMTSSIPGKTLRTQEENNSPALVLPLTVRQGTASDMSYLVFGEDYTQTYNSKDDVMCLFDESGNSGYVRPVSLYTLSSDKVRMNLQTLPEQVLQTSYRIPLGIRTPSTENITINLGNLSGLPKDVKLSIYDAMTGKSHSLENQSMYTFENVQPKSDYFLDDRFFLDIEKLGTSIEEEKIDKARIWADSKQGNLILHSALPMQKVEVYTLTGVKVHSARPFAKDYSVKVDAAQMYMIKVETEEGKTTLKIVDRK